MAQLPSTGITTNIVSNCIGLGTTNVGTLCKSNKINKWSKWKPIATNATTLDNTAIVTLKSGLALPLMNLYNYKLFATGEDAGGFDIYNENTQKKWTYTPPAGTASQPYRIGDFRNYQSSAVPMFNLTAVESSKYVGDVPTYNWTFTLTPSQATGGLVAGDLFPSNYHLGVMVVDWENDGFPVKSFVANNSDISTNQTVTIDIASFNSGTYLLCFFVYSNATGIAQTNNPATGTTAAITNIYPLENGVVMVGIENYYNLPSDLWKFPNYKPVGSDFNSNLSYTLFTGTYTPTVATEALPPVTMNWDNYQDTFTIEPTISPSALYKWNVKIKMYDDTINWVNDTYKGLITWSDTDTVPLTIAMKTNSSNVITIAMVESGNFATPIFTITTTNTLSTSSSTPTVIEISNFNSSSINKIGIKVDTNTYTPTMGTEWMTQAENPPIFNFGYNVDGINAPVGLTYNEILVSAYGKV